jgi:hypothetical protein
MPPRNEAGIEYSLCAALDWSPISHLLQATVPEGRGAVNEGREGLVKRMGSGFKPAKALIRGLLACRYPYRLYF